MRLVPQLSTFQLILVVAGVLAGVALLAALLTGFLVRRGLRTPTGLRLINRTRTRVIAVVKRPITVMVLDEVAEVIQTGHYTRNISAALVENHDELKHLVAEKVKDDPNVRLIGKLPGYDLIIGEVTETTLRVLIEMLGDPRMDELISDLLRNNIQQIRAAVRAREADVPVPVPPADELSAAERRLDRRRGRGVS